MVSLPVHIFVDSTGKQNVYRQLASKSKVVTDGGVDILS